MDKKSEDIERKQKRKKITNIVSVIVLVVSIVALAVEGVVFYFRSYLSPFWVNGQSMYPYLNGNATDANGELIGKNGGGDRIGATIDYGVMDEHDSAIKKIKRFDIVVTKYSLEDSKIKIKRVIALPGETLEFIVTGIGAEHNGDLYINGEYVTQPIDSELVQSGSYPEGKITLKDDQYFVCGDNRTGGNSSDSRTIGPIRRSYIIGRAVAICGTAVTYRGDDGSIQIKDIKYKWPRYLR